MSLLVIRGQISRVGRIRKVFDLAGGGIRMDLFLASRLIRRFVGLLRVVGRIGVMGGRRVKGRGRMVMTLC